MLNGLGQIQKIVLVGTTSDIGNKILEKLDRAPDSVVYTVGLNPQSDFFLDLRKPLDFEKLDNFFNIGDIDFVILASGLLGTNPSDASFDELTMAANVNFTNTSLLLFYFARKFKAQGHGSILLLSSMAVTRPRISNFFYGASKLGSDFVARGLSYDKDYSCINVHIFRFGFVKTKMSSHLKTPLLAISADRAAECVIRGINKKKKIIYAPLIMRLVLLMLRILPGQIFARIG